jgi:RNA polymerase sigma-70 factor, ECF subfamily
VTSPVVPADPASAGDGPAILTLLREHGSGGKAALDRLFPLVYEELRDIARRHLRRARRGQTLNTTALVHESYLKLVKQAQHRWQDRAHFLALAATAMRHILVDHARARGRSKRGGGRVQVTLRPELAVVRESSLDVLALDEAMRRLACFEPRLERVVECRFFGGMSSEETAEVLGVSPRTVERDWLRAKAYLYRLLTPDTPGAETLPEP